jgi:P-type E1-E2 ATPase
MIAACAVAMGLVFFGVSFAIGGSIHTGLLVGVGVIVALVPNGLLATVTTSLAISARRMARRGALVRHLESIETLGATTVICSDRTGTMTANQMTVEACWSENPNRCDSEASRPKACCARR